MKYTRFSYLFLLSFAILIYIPCATAQTLKITSKPSGAKVELDGVVVGTTPYEVKVPGGYFHKTRSVFGARLEHAIRAATVDGVCIKKGEGAAPSPKKRRH